MKNSTVQSYRELIVWQKSIKLVMAVYGLTNNFPKTEIYGLVSQMKRAAVSIPSNIAEGRMRGSRKEFKHFLSTAFGSGAELETQLEISRILSFGKEIDYQKVESLLNEVMRMLNRMISVLKAIS